METLKPYSQSMDIQKRETEIFCSPFLYILFVTTTRSASGCHKQNKAPPEFTIRGLCTELAAGL